MSPLNGHTKHAIVRILVVAASGIAAGFLFRRSLIFIPTMVAFQFTYSSITAALFYGFLKSLSLRNALVAVLVWYVTSTMIDVKNSSTFLMYLVYVSGISAAVYAYVRITRRPVFNGILQRIATFSLLTAFMNALILLVLMALSAVLWRVSLQRAPRLSLDNFQIGALIGLGLGTGIEIAEYILSLKSFRQFIEGAR